MVMCHLGYIFLVEYRRGLFWDHCCLSFINENDIDKGIVSKLLKFSDDTKLVGKVSSEDEIEQLRTDLSRLYSWSIDWQMLGYLTRISAR